MFLSNTNPSSEITQKEMSIIPDKSSNHEKADIKLVVLTGNTFIRQVHTVTVRSPSKDINILVLFLLHKFENIAVVIDKGVGKN